MTGRLVWVRNGESVSCSADGKIDREFLAPDRVWQRPLPPTAADIDALVTDGLIRKAYAAAHGRVAGKTIGEAQDSIARETIKAALRELLGIKL